MNHRRSDPRHRPSRWAACALLSATLSMAATTENIPAGAQVPQLRNVTVKQQLGKQVPTDLVFQDETGRTVRFGDYLGQRPLVLILGYYRCPMLCSMVLNGAVKALKVVPFAMGDAYDVVTVSIDPREKSGLAMTKKESYVEAYGRPGAEKGWHFLTGDQKDIVRLAHTVGFGFEYDLKKDQYAHASTIMVLTPQGRVARYLFGIEYSGRDLRLALVEAAAGRIGTPVDQVLLYCFHYDPETGKYSMSILNVIRGAGLLTMGAIVALVVYLARRGPRLPASPRLASGGV